MTRPKVEGRYMPPRNLAKGIKLNEGVTVSKSKSTKLSRARGKGRGKEKAPTSPDVNSYSDDMYATYLTSSERKDEHQEYHSGKECAM